MHKEQDPADVIYLNSLQIDPPKVRSVPAEGLPCEQCGQVIEPPQNEYHLQGEGADPPVRLHVHCFPAWRAAGTRDC